MAVTVRESLTSRNLLRNQDGTATAPRVFHVFGDELTPVETADEVRALMGSSLPAVADPHPDFPHLVRTRKEDIRLVPGHSDLWRVGLEYTGEDTGNGFPPTDFWDVSSSAVRLDVPTWRVDATPPNDIDSPDETDINGRKIDHHGGHPFNLVQTALMRTYRRRVLRLLIDEPGILLQVRTRNSTAFQGFPAGSLVFASYEITADGESPYADLSYTFGYDPYFHLRQRPDTYAEGNVRLDVNGHASDVFWFQQYPVRSDFNALFGT